MIEEADTLAVLSSMHIEALNLSNGNEARFELGFIERFRPKRGRTREQ
jgi:hypothetical protein